MLTNSDLLIHYADGDVILRRRADKFLLSLTLLIACSIVYLTWQILSGLPNLEFYLCSLLSLFFFLMALYLFINGYFALASNTVVVILFLINVFFAFGEPKRGDYVLYRMALFQGVALIFTVMIASRRRQILFVSSGTVITCALLLIRDTGLTREQGLLPYSSTFIPVLLYILAETGIGVAVFHMMNSALEETRDSLEKDIPSRLPNLKMLCRKTWEHCNEGAPFHILFVKIENFPELFLNLSHDSALSVIVQTAGYLTGIFGSDVYRLSQDVLGLISFDSPETIRDRMEEAAEYFRRPVPMASLRIQLTVRQTALSAGEKDGDIQNIINRGYLSLYQAGQEKKYCLMPEERDEELQNNRINFLKSLSVAIERDEFQIHYQPIVDGDRRITSFEALSRWRSEEGQMISPAFFIPLMERTGLIFDFFTLMIGKVLTDIKCYGELFRDATVWVNISPELINKGYDFEDLVRLIDSSGIPHGQLGFELTETSLARDLSAISELISYLQNHGFAIALDDFGMGYSNLTQVLHQNFHKIKFDRSFLQDLSRKPGNKHLLKLLIQFFQDHGYATVVEGIETEEEFRRVKSYGCHSFQGFLFHRPDSPQTLLRRLGLAV